VRTLAGAGIAVLVVTSYPGGAHAEGWGVRGAAALAVAAGSIGLRNRWSTLSGAARVLFALTCLWLLHCAVTGRPTLWMAVYDWAPPLRALRAIARFGLFIAIPIGLGVGLALAHLSQRRGGTAIVAGLTALCMLEQVTSTPSFSKQQHRQHIRNIAKAIPEAADVFFYSPVRSGRGLWLDQLDGMFAQLAMQRGIPTINGNLNVVPIAWQRLSTPNIDQPRSRVRLELGLEEWRALHPQLLDLRIEWVQVPAAHSPPAAKRVLRDRAR
jgi:hypothetical protein